VALSNIPRLLLGGSANETPDICSCPQAIPSSLRRSIHVRMCDCGCGLVFRLSPASGGSWTETILHAFTGVNDGSLPSGGVVLDSAGNLYGNAELGGAYGWGGVFKITPVDPESNEE
jgi:hypothetical protein